MAAAQGQSPNNDRKAKVPGVTKDVKIALCRTSRASVLALPPGQVWVTLFFPHHPPSTRWFHESPFVKEWLRNSCENLCVQEWGGAAGQGGQWDRETENLIR